jgi:Transposase DDE domain group 1
MTGILAECYFLDVGQGAAQVILSLSSDGGALLLRQVDHNLGLTLELAGCFSDLRDSRFVDHSVEQLLSQRIYGVALGYEDLNDHERLRLDPLLPDHSTVGP